MGATLGELNHIDRVKGIIADVESERERQRTLAIGGNTDEFDKGNAKNDWVGYITAYAGRAAAKVVKNEKQNEDFRTNMVKVAALAVAAIEAYDKGYTK